MTRKIALMLLPAVLCLSCLGEKPAPMRIGTNIWPGYEPIWLAAGMKYFGPDDVMPLAYSSTTDVMSDFRKKKIDAAAVTLDEALTLMQFDADFSIILVADVSNGADVVMGKAEIKSMKDLKGRRVGLETTAVTAYTLSRGLQFAGLSQKDLKIVNLNLNEHEEAFKEGRVDAVVTFELARTKLLKAGARILFDSSMIPDEIFDVVIVRKEYLLKHPGRVDSFMKGWFGALKYLGEHPNEAADRMKERMKLGRDEILASYKGLKLPDLDENRRLLSGSPPPLAASAKRLQDLMIEQRLLFKRGAPEALVDVSFLERLYK